ncbi:MAG: YkgJ family cysteine cluster protein [Verrucomicrobiae bacterium]|nr:YkgJ family cysteine cluster protein [Verrucomicrobiae bacterium]
MPRRPPPLTDTLCLRCGLCCNGVLFADVELRPGDDPAALTEAGVPLTCKHGKIKFPQPCPCLEQGRCRIYEQRPMRCRAFDCRLLQRAQEGKIALNEARYLIRITREQAERVRRLVRVLGQRDEQMPLSRRYQAVMREPLDLSQGERHQRRRGDLLLAVYELTRLLEQHFLGTPPVSDR